MSEQEDLSPKETQMVANVSEVLDNATKDHKDECYDSILLVMANEEHIAFASAGKPVDLGLAITRSLLRQPDMIPIFQSSILTAIDLLQNHADTNERD